MNNSTSKEPEGRERYDKGQLLAKDKIMTTHHLKNAPEIQQWTVHLINLCVCETDTQRLDL